MKQCETVYNVLDQAKGMDIQIFDVSERLPLTHYFIIVTANGTTHATSLADKAREALGQDYKHMEGDNNSTWILVDGGDIIVHIFTAEERDNYNLEKLLEKTRRVK